MPWAKLDDQYPTKDKLVRAGLEAMGFDVAGICYCARNLTDGFIADDDLVVVYPSTRQPKRLADHLVKVGRWEREEGGYRIHDYLDYNPSRAEVLAKREARSKAGSKGGSKQPSKPEANSQANSEANGLSEQGANTQAPSNPVSRIPVPLRDVSKSQTAIAKRLSDACKTPHPEDAERIVTLLAQHIDLRLVDECIGWAEQRDEKSKPRNPVYFLRTVPDWARQRGVAVPDLHLSVDA